MFQNLKLAEILADHFPLFLSPKSRGYAFASQECSSSQLVANPILAFAWPDGVQDQQHLPLEGELTIGNIVIRRARVRYYLEQIDNAFPAFLNGQAINGARTLNHGDVLQIDELQTIFQLGTA